MKNKNILISIQKDLIKKKKRRQIYYRIFWLLTVLSVIFFVSRSNEYQMIIVGTSLIIGIVAVCIIPQPRVFISPEEIHKKIEKRIAFLEAEKKSAKTQKKTEIDEEEDELKEVLFSIDHPEEEK
jgi:hypothetical protein